MRTESCRAARYPSLVSTSWLAGVPLPGATEGTALVLESNELEDLSTGDHYRIEQVQVPRLPQARDLCRLELPEFFLVDTVQPLYLQRHAVIQHDVEHYRSKQIQGEHGCDELFGRR